MLRLKSKTPSHILGSPRRYRSSWTLAGLLAGIACGLTFGEYCAGLAPFGDAFVGLLQMTVLPYIIVSLIANLGRLPWQQSRRLGIVGGGVLLVLWGIGLFTIFVVPHCFPEWKAGSFFSTAIMDGTNTVDLVKVFVPANVFAALAENYIPAVVVFCICVGLALTGVDGKHALIDQLDVLAKALIRVSGFIAAWTPLGVFAIAASTAGTISWSELQRLQAYLIAFTGATLFLLVVVLPGLIMTCTPFRYRDVWRVSRNALLTAFATGKLIVALPILIDETERLVSERSNGDVSTTVPAVDVLYPLAYPFPHLGRLMGLLFIPFAAWFLGRSLQDQEYPAFLLSGLFSYFGGPIVATPFLLDQLHLPHDMFQLFVLSSVYCGRLGDALGAMHLVAFTLLSISAFNGWWQLTAWRLIRFVLVSTLLGVALLAALRITLANSLRYVEKKEDIIAHMHLIEQPMPYKVLTTSAPNPDRLLPSESLLSRVRRRGVLRVGFNEDKLPFAYFNSRGKLVGLDINMAHQLARDMGVTLEFVRFDRRHLTEALRADHFDLVMSGLKGTVERSEQMQHSKPYMNVTMALVAPDYRIREFASLERIQRQGRLRIGYAEQDGSFSERLLEILPNVELVEINSNHDYFDGAWRELDGLLISAESGSAFTLLHPDFEVVVPTGSQVAVPLFYAIGQRDEAMGDFLNHWLDLRKLDGTLQGLYDYWILGKSAAGSQRRWSLIRQLGWVE